MHKRTSSRATSSRSLKDSNPNSPTENNNLASNELAVDGAKLYTLSSQVAVLINEVLDAGDKGKAKEEELSNHLRSCSQALQDSTSLVSLLCLQASDKLDVELQRISAKVDRALERLRRPITTLLERLSTTNDALVPDLTHLLLVISQVMEDTLNQMSSLKRSPNLINIISDFTSRTLDSIFILAKLDLKLKNPETYEIASQRLSRGYTILSNVSSTGILLGNYLRCLSGAHYNFAGILYQAGRYGQVIPFAKDACTIGSKALQCRLKEKANMEEKNREQEGWKQLEETLFRRWELLGACHVKIGDRKNAYTTFLQCIGAFPYRIHDLAIAANKHPVSSIFAASNASFKQLAAIIERLTYLGFNELLLPPQKISLGYLIPKLPGSSWDSSVIGILIEQQVECLEQRSWKDSIQKGTKCLLEEALKVYTTESQMPIRRTRVLLRLLENLYRTDDIPPFAHIQTMAQEVEDLLVKEELGADTELSPYKDQYRASAHLWLSLHAHRAAIDNQASFMSGHIGLACRILRLSISPPVQSPKVLVKKSLTPQQPVRTTRRRAAASTTTTTKTTTTATTRTTTRRTTTRKVTSATKKEPAVSHPKRAALQPVFMNIVTPTKTKTQPKRTILFDDFEKLSGLLQTVARVLGLLSLSLPKVQILDISRKLAELNAGISSEGYISASLDLAHEYMRIGKTRRATSIFNQALETVRNGQVSDEISTVFLLRFAESLALAENVPRSATVYCEAVSISQRIDNDEKTGSSVQRIQARVRRLEKAAMAARTVALMQHCKEDTTLSIDYLLQSLRLWNRAMDNLMRLNPPPPKSKPAVEENPFDMSSLKQALPPSEAAPLADPTPQMSVPPQRHLDSLGLRISDGLFTVLFDLAEVYLTRGSVRESEFFIKQAIELAEALNAPAMHCRALAKQGEIQLREGNMQDGYQTLMKAGELSKDIPTIDAVEVHRLCAEYDSKTNNEESAQELYRKSVNLLEEIDNAFQQYEVVAFGSGQRKSLSLGVSPAVNNGKVVKDVIMPEVLMAVLKQQIWSLKDQNNEQFNTLLERFISLSRSSLTKADENAFLAKLNLHNVYLQFQGDMFLNSIAESPIAIPMGMHAAQGPGSASAQDILNALDQAEEQFWSSLSSVARTGNVLNVREAATALAVIKSFQSSMGHNDNNVNFMVSRLLDASSALTLRREMIEAIHHKFPRSPGPDDMQWPLITKEGTIRPQPINNNFLARKRANIPIDSEDDDVEMEVLELSSPLKLYWQSVRSRYRSYVLDPTSLSTSQAERLTSNWTVIHINLTEDMNTLFVSRQEGGSGGDSLVFSVPLKSRRDNGSGDDEEEYLTFSDAMVELKEIIRLSDEGTKAAVKIKADEEARMAWWKQRRDLDLRMKNLLENIEFCWLGAFKTILSPKCQSSPEAIAELRKQFERVFKQSFGIQDKRATGRKKKSSSATQAPVFEQIQLDDTLLRCFSTLSPKCRDEELEDLIYFILDLYQFHGVPIPISEVDITQMVVDMRMVLEEHASKNQVPNPKRSTKTKDNNRSGVGGDDEHIFLVLDKNLQGLPWESIPILRGRSVSRVPSLDFVIDRLEYANVRRRSSMIQQKEQKFTGAVVDPRKGYFILNPSGDLAGTEGRFKEWTEGMKKIGWDGVVGKPVSEQQFENALSQRDLVVYFGHGGGEQYLRSYKVRRLQKCAATMLWGCSSGALKEMGDFDRTGTANAYMLAGCPTLVANLWDVTDRDIDKFCQSVFDKIKLTPEHVKNWKSSGHGEDGNVSVVEAVAQARNACKLKYLTGAAPVVYGIPFYL